MTLLNLAAVAWLAGTDDEEAGQPGPAMTFPTLPLGAVLTGAG